MEREGEGVVVVRHVRFINTYMYSKGTVRLMSIHSHTDVATVVGYMVVSRPFLNPAHTGLMDTSHSERTLVGIVS